ncbi:hypothetical protein ABN067_21985 [Providencia rettgeri]
MNEKIIGSISRIKLIMSSINDHSDGSENKFFIIINEFISDVESYIKDQSDLILSFEERNARWINESSKIDPMIMSIIIHLENKALVLENEINELINSN